MKRLTGSGCFQRIRKKRPYVTVHQRFRRRGSVALLLCVIAAPLILILSTFLLGIQIRAAELDVDRALSYQVQTRLSGFNKALFDEFGILALTSVDRSANFQKVLPDNLKTLKVKQIAGQPLTDTSILQQSILTFMRQRLPASLAKTIADQTGIRVNSSKTAPSKSSASFQSTNSIQNVVSITTFVPDPIMDKLSGMVQEAVFTLLGKAIYALLDDEIKEALTQYQRFVAECVSAGSNDDQQLAAYPDIFNPNQISSFTDMISQSMTVPTSEFYNSLAIREYILATFWPAGKPSQAASALLSGTGLSGDSLVHRNLSGVPLKQYPGREPGELEQILTGSKTPKAGIEQVKAMLVMYRAALYLIQKISKSSEMEKYRASAAALSVLIATVSAGAIAISPDVITYLLLACDAIRQGFTDYAKLMIGERLHFTTVKSSDVLALDYVMHLRILLLLSSGKKLLQRTSEMIAKRHPGTHNTQISVSCDFRGSTRTQQGSLLTIGMPS